MTRLDAGISLLKRIYLRPELLDEISALREDFILQHQIIYDTFLWLSDQKVSLDMDSILETLKTSGNDIPFSVVSDIIAGDVNPNTWDVYDKALVEASRTEVLSKALMMAHNVLLEEGYQASIDMVETAFSETMRKTASSKVIGDHMNSVLDRIKMYKNQKASFSGLETGSIDFDRLTGGLQKKELVILAARPSIGKTTLALQWASFISKNPETPVGFISLEMAGDLLSEKLVFSESGLDSSKIKKGFFKSGDLGRISSVMGEIFEQKLFIDDSINMNIGELKGSARRWVRKNGIKVLFVDYLTKIVHPNQKLDKREQIGHFTDQLKGLAKELEIPVVCLAQVDRKAEGAMPTLNMLRESADIEQDADVVIFLHRDRVDDTTPTQLIVAKNRNGETGTEHLFFNKPKGTFENIKQGDY